MQNIKQMSTVLFPKNRGVFKSGNGAEYLQFLEKVAQKKNLDEMSAYMDTRDNVYYTKFRDEVEARQARIYDLK